MPPESNGNISTVPGATGSILTATNVGYLAQAGSYRVWMMNAANPAGLASNWAKLTIGPAILGLVPASLAVNEGDPVSFSAVSGPDGSVPCLAIQADGKTLIGGGFVSVNGEPRNHIARLNPDGTLDHTFQQGMIGANDWVRSMVVQPDGKIVIVGSFTLVNSAVRDRIARLNPDGSLDISGSKTEARSSGRPTAASC